MGCNGVVFEPNDEPLWAQIRLNAGAFMQNLFCQGAFQGSTPKKAYFVRCDRSTMTPDEIKRGIVNIIVGFAPAQTCGVCGHSNKTISRSSSNLVI